MQSTRIIAPPFPNPTKWAAVRYEQLHLGMQQQWATSAFYSRDLFPLAHLLALAPSAHTDHSNNHAACDEASASYLQQVFEGRTVTEGQESPLHGSMGVKKQHLVPVDCGVLDGGEFDNDEDIEPVVELQLSEEWTARLAKTTKRLQKNAYKVTSRKWKHKKKKNSTGADS